MKDPGKTKVSGRILAIDFETFYDSKEQYSLTSMDPSSYVNDPRFDAYLVSVVSETGDEYVGDPKGFDWSCCAGALLLAHNAAFDGLVVERLIELGIIPEFEPAGKNWICTADMVSYLCAPRSLKGACEELLGIKLSKQARSDMNGRHFHELSPEDRQVMIDYAAVDSRMCMQLFLAYGDQFPQTERDISKANREAGWRGIRIDRAMVEAGLKTLTAVRNEAAKSLPWYNPENPNEGSKPGSTGALALHAKSLGLDVPRSFNKQDPAMQAWVARHKDAHPFIQARLDFSSVVTHIARLESMLALADKDDILRFSLKYFGCHCLTGDHEVLTRDGWVRLECWRGGDIVQWRENNTVGFLPAKRNSFRNEEPHMVLIDTPQVKAKMTLGHTVPVILNGMLHPCKAEDLLDLSCDIRIPAFPGPNVWLDPAEAVVVPLACITRSGAEPEVYCPSTETGYFLVRYRGVVSVTGNTGRSKSGRDDGDGNKAETKFNPLNQPKGDDNGLTFGVDMRGMLVPRKGHVFMIYDFSQIESRIVQWLSGNTRFLDLIRKIGNIYEADAVQSGLWDPANGALKKQDRKLYASSKERVLGLGFGMGTAKFLATCRRKNVDIGEIPKQDWVLDRRVKFLLRNKTHLNWDSPQDEREVSAFMAADRLVADWRRANEPVTKFWRALQDDLTAAADRGDPFHDFILPSGRFKRYYRPHISSQATVLKDPDTGEESTRMERRLYASLIKGEPGESLHGGVITENIVQATARDVMFWGVLDVIRYAPSWSFLWDVYDEVIFEVPLADAESASKVIPDCLCRGSSLSWTKGLPLDVEGGPMERYAK